MNSPSVIQLNLENLNGLQSTPEYGACLAQAGAVCLEHQGHPSGIVMRVYGTFEVSASITWSPATEAMRRCWNDLVYATEHGAYGLALLLMEAMTGLTIIERSYRGTGFDFWLGSQDGVLFQKKVRLEVSGILRGDMGDVRTRTAAKLAQIRSSGSSLPAFVVVVEFGQPVSRIEKK